MAIKAAVNGSGWIVKLFSGYDNERGCPNRVVDLAVGVAGI